MPVPVIASIAEMRARSAAWRQEGRRIGYVATMGALHAGHLSLVRRAAAECEVVAVSIFVNPTQFGPGEDFARYPRDLTGDLRKLEAERVDAVFAPSTSEIYPEDAAATVDPGPIGNVLEGAIRPGHFRGVATVVTKLFHIMAPHHTYFGQKDAQQATIVQRLVRDLNFDLTVVVCPTVREGDGVALSSRNVYLSPPERAAATVLWGALQAARGDYQAGERDRDRLERRMAGIVGAEPLARLQYAACVDPGSFEPPPRVLAGSLLAVAATIGTTRLIDNTSIGESDSR